MFSNIIFFQNISVSVYMCKNRKVIGAMKNVVEDHIYKI